jgi:hypothetical protein
MFSLDDLEEMIIEKVRKVLTHFRYGDNGIVLKELVNQQLLQEIQDDLKRLCNKNNKNFYDPVYNVRVEDFEFIKKKYENWRV